MLVDQLPFITTFLEFLAPKCDENEPITQDFLNMKFDLNMECGDY